MSRQAEWPSEPIFSVQAIQSEQGNPVTLEECHILPLFHAEKQSMQYLLTAVEFLLEKDTPIKTPGEGAVMMNLHTSSRMKFVADQIKKGNDLSSDNGIIFDMVKLTEQNFMVTWGKHFPETGEFVFEDRGIDYEAFDRFIYLYDRFVNQYKQDIGFESSIKRIRELRINGILLPLFENTVIIQGSPFWHVSDRRISNDNTVNSEDPQPERYPTYLYLPSDDLEETFFDYVGNNFGSLWQQIDFERLDTSTYDMPFSVDIKKILELNTSVFFLECERSLQDSTDFYSMNLLITTKLATEMMMLWSIARFGLWAKKMAQSNELVTAVGQYYRERQGHVLDFFSGLTNENLFAYAMSPKNPAIYGDNIEEDRKTKNANEHRISKAVTKTVDFVSLFETLESSLQVLETVSSENPGHILTLFDIINKRDYTGSEEQFEADILYVTSLPWEMYIENDM